MKHFQKTFKSSIWLFYYKLLIVKLSTTVWSVMTFVLFKSLENLNFQKVYSYCNVKEYISNFQLKNLLSKYLKNNSLYKL